MSWLLHSLLQIPLVLRLRPVIWRRAAASDEIWRVTLGTRPPRAIFPQGRAWYAKFRAYAQASAFADSAIKLTEHR